MGMLGANNGAFLASMPPSQAPEGFAPNPIVALPKIAINEPGTDVQPGTTMRVTIDRAGSDVTFLLGDQPVSARQLIPFNVFFITIPAMEPGTVNLRVRTNGLESEPVKLHISAGDNLPTQSIAGQAFYQKIDWALDISRGEFRDLELKGIPARLVRRDPETQLIVTMTGQKQSCS